MNIKKINPSTSKEFESYYNLRWWILREPWGQIKGSERDKDDEVSHHRMIIDKKTGNALAATGVAVAVGRLHFNSKEEAQIRYMAVAENYQGQGIGSKIVAVLEDIALEKGANRIILQARENALKFYRKNGYEIIERSYLLFDEIQHWLMNTN